MALSVAHEQLLASLVENSMVKAALLLDLQGRVRGLRGSAQMLRHGGSSVQIDPTYRQLQQEASAKPRENVYLVELQDGILAVIFQDDVDFERVRKLSDTLLAHLQLKLA